MHPNPNTFEPQVAASEIEAQLRAIGSSERAEGEKRYLKSDLGHLGTTVPEIRRAVRSLVRQHRELTHEQLLRLTAALWARPIFECRLAAVLILIEYPHLVTADDLPLIRRLVRGSHTWALVDPLAGNVLGGLVVRDPDASDNVDAWIEDPDFWVRRAAILSTLAQIRSSGEADLTAGFERFTRYAEAALEEREFFIRKAIGWVLRETAKREPDLVYDWLKPRIARASGVTVREAVKYLDAARRDELLAAYRARAR